MTTSNFRAIDPSSRVRVDQNSVLQQKESRVFQSTLADGQGRAMSGTHRKRQKRGHKRGKDLESKVRESGGRTGFGLAANENSDGENSSTQGNKSVLSHGKSKAGRSRARSSVISRRSAHIVCAISENLAKETCVASLDASAPVHLQVTKQGNGQTYAETLAYLELLNPHEILLNEGRASSTLARKIMELNPEEEQANAESKGPSSTKAVVKFISRACFDQTKGAELLSRMAREETYDASVVCEYILLSSAHAVLQYTQQQLGATFARKSLDLLVNAGGTGKMVIDRSTLMQLELLANAKSGKTKCSLIATIDYTKTSVGSRLLRTNLMAPPTRADTITSRLDLVDTFLANEDFFYSVLELLQNLPCLDQMLTNVALVPQKRISKKNKEAASAGGTEVTKKVARKGISALVGIKTMLSALPAFIQVLEGRLHELDSMAQSQQREPDDASTLRSSLLLGLGGAGPESSASEVQEHHLLRAIIIAMKNPALASILTTVSETFTNSTTSAHRSSHAMRHEECFALQAESTSMMNVLRKAFLANVDDIYNFADDLSGKHGFYVSVRYSSNRGYYLAVPEGTALPQEFIHPAKNGRFITCTTEQVHSLNIRAQDNVQDLLYMTDSRIQEVLKHARSQYDALAALSDAIAILDLCHNFADCVTSKSNRPWCRPMLTTAEVKEEGGAHGAMVIKNGRYIIEVSNCLTASDGIQDFVANDTYTTSAKTFTVITGINGSGKSTYLKQIAIIVIMAQCGGYVPAEFATIPVRDRLCTRIGNTDDPEHNISTFMYEMKETAFICRHATPRSLLLIDELGRATSNEDGVALAWAVSERILESGALCFFVTHYPQVTLLGHRKMYSSVQNQHMAASIGANEGEGGEISYTHKVSSGPCKVATAYGVDLAYACGWPDDVLTEARNYESRLKEVADETQLVVEPTAEDEDEGDSPTSQHLAWRRLVQKMKLLKTDGSLGAMAVKDDLQKIAEMVGGYSFIQEHFLDTSPPKTCGDGDNRHRLDSRERSGAQRPLLSASSKSAIDVASSSESESSSSESSSSNSSDSDSDEESEG